MNYDMKECGKRVQQLRIQKGYTQETLANRLSIDRSLLSYIESGKRGCSVDLLVQLSDVFGVSLDILVLGKEKVVMDTEDKKLLKLCIKDLIARLIAFQEKL